MFKLFRNCEIQTNWFVCPPLRAGLHAAKELAQPTLFELRLANAEVRRQERDIRLVTAKYKDK